MSDILSVVNDVVGFFGDLIGDVDAPTPLVISSQRQIASLYPHIVVEEVHHDELQITQHPVETGAAISDHAYVQPYTVEIHAMWSDATAETSGFVQAVYQALLSIQASREPVDIVTGKRAYSNMMIKAVSVTTNDNSEWALDCMIIGQYVIIVGQSFASSSGSSGSPTDPSNGVNAAPLDNAPSAGEYQDFIARGGFPTQSSGGGYSPLSNSTSTVPLLN